MVNTPITQSPPMVIDRLVIGGCGNRIHAFLGALYKLRKHWRHTKHFIGVSGGSMLATLLALGCSIKQIVQKEREIPFVLHYSWLLKGLFHCIWYQDGWIPISNLRTYLCHALDSMSPHSSETLTFEFLYQARQVKLEIQSLDWHTGEPIVFNHLQFPTMLVVDAITASCAIPIVFSPCILSSLPNRTLCDYAIFHGVPWKSLSWPMNKYENRFLPVEPSCQTLGLILSESNMEENHMEGFFNYVWRCLLLASDGHRYQETQGTCMQGHLIRIKVDPTIYGSMFHSLWPTRKDKLNLFKQGKNDSQKVSL